MPNIPERPRPPQADRLAVPSLLTWLRDEAALRPSSIARLVGLPPDALARWTAGAGEPSDAEAFLVAALLRLQERVAERHPDARARRAWWSNGRREAGWLSPAELLRRGKIGEVLMLLSADAADCDADR